MKYPNIVYTYAGVGIMLLVLVVRFSGWVTLENEDIATVTTSIIRIIVAVKVYQLAKDLNLVTWSWTLFAFFLPPICLIMIGLNKRTKNPRIS